MNKLILLLTLGLFSMTAFAQWQIKSFNHPAAKTQSQSAIIRNDDGFELAIFKTDKGIVWMDFSLSDYDFSELSQDQLPRFQIDDRKPVQLMRGFVATIVPPNEGIAAIVIDENKNVSTDKDFSVEHIIAERLPERVICPIWQGEDRPHFGTLEALTTGQQIRFDYVLLDGSKGQTVFTLEGVKHAIETAVSK